MKKQTMPSVAVLPSYKARTSFQWVREGRATRRQQKHELLLTFMAYAKAKRRKPTPINAGLLKTLLSLFG